MKSRRSDFRPNFAGENGLLHIPKVKAHLRGWAAAPSGVFDA